MAEHLLGIRHHGPGSARSVGCALEQIRPDVILIEAPSDAQSLLPLAAHQDMEPPVAMLLYAADDPASALSFPFASFSPEWVALRHAAARDIPVRFLDLPASTTLALQAQASQGSDTAPLWPQDAPDDGTAPVRADPLFALARAAGYEDGERWWERMVEERRDGAPLFEALADAMTALRQRVADDEPTGPEPSREARREAHMRKVLRQARKDGFERIVVVCGAWHVPALRNLPPASHDRRWLSKLPKRKVMATWIPWSHGRLTLASGYGAGVASPGWYHHLFSCPDHVAVRWLHRMAGHLRERGLDAAPAQIIDAVRLAEALAALRDRPAPGLGELHEAAEAVLLAGESLPWTLIRQRLLVGERLGRVPADTPMIPLHRDIVQLQRRLRLRPDDGDREIVLDLRKPADRERSMLIRRLQLLDVPWGEGGDRGEGKGTFKESWELAWDPEFVLQIIEHSHHGTTLREAATSRSLERARQASSLPALAEIVHAVVFADLPAAIPEVMHRVQHEAAVASDLTHLMRCLPDFVHLIRYGDVRGTPVEPVAEVVDGMVARVCVGLPAACHAVRDDAARPLFDGVVEMQAALALWNDDAKTRSWHEALRRVTDSSGTAPLLRGRAARLLLDAGCIDAAEAARRLSYHLSRASSPERAAAWIDGFLRGSGQVLVYDDALFALVDAWLEELPERDFLELLPVIRRTFASFTEPERRAMGTKARSVTGTGPRRDAASPDACLDAQRAARSLPLVRRLLGLQEDR